MKVHFDIQGDKIKGLDIRFTPIEGLILHRALLQFAHELSNNEVDRITAMRMCDDFDDSVKRKG